MQIPDAINGALEVTWSAVMLLSILKLRKDRDLKGVSFWHVGLIFVSSWWFMFYYAHLDQWFSFLASLVYAVAVATWSGHIAYYFMKPRVWWDMTPKERKWVKRRWRDA